MHPDRILRSYNHSHRALPSTYMYYILHITYGIQPRPRQHDDVDGRQSHCDDWCWIFQMQQARIGPLSLKVDSWILTTCTNQQLSWWWWWNFYATDVFRRKKPVSRNNSKSAQILLMTLFATFSVNIIQTLQNVFPHKFTQLTRFLCNCRSQRS